jgi:hypothetical protein
VSADACGRWRFQSIQASKGKAAARVECDGPEAGERAGQGSWGRRWPGEPFREEAIAAPMVPLVQCR